METVVAAYPPAAAATSSPGLCTAHRGILGSLSSQKSNQISREGMRVFNYQSVTVPDTRILHNSRKWDPYPFLRRVVHSITIPYSHLNQEYGLPRMPSLLIAHLSSCQSPAFPGLSQWL